MRKDRISWIALFLLSLALTACGSGNQQTTSLYPSLKNVSGASIELQENYNVRREFIGALQAPQRVGLSFDAAGPIKAMLVNEGDVVAEGQVLAELDDEVLRAELNAAQANRRDLRSRLDFNQRELKRLDELRARNFASESKYDELETQRRSLRAQIDSISASIQSLETRIAKTVLRAPFTANVSARFLDEGAIVNSGTAVFQLLENDELQVRLGMPVPLARTLQVGDLLSALVEGKEYSVKVRSIGLSVSFSTNTVPVELELVTTDEDDKLYDGQIVRLLINETREEHGAWVPVDSLVAGVRGSWDVYVLVPPPGGATTDTGVSSNALDGDAAKDVFRVERRKVSVAYVGGGRAYVSHGLNDGDLLVDRGVQKIASGQTVKLHPPSVLAQAL